MTLSPDELHNLLTYEENIGKLYWLERSSDTFEDGPHQAAARKAKAWNNRWSGIEAFTYTMPNGYKSGHLLSKPHLAHRVIWAMVRGEWPEDQIDHINHNRSDNRIKNLRSVTVRENSMNSSIRSDNSSGVTGVTWVKREQRWVAQIQIKGKHIYLGQFVDMESAILARKAGSRKYGFHENHGER